MDSDGVVNGLMWQDCSGGAVHKPYTNAPFVH